MELICNGAYIAYARGHRINECECMVGKSTLCLVFDWVGSVNGTTSNRVALLIKMVKKICVGY